MNYARIMCGHNYLLTTLIVVPYMELDYHVENYICTLSLTDGFATDHGESVIKLVNTSLQGKILGMIISCSQVQKMGDDEIDWVVSIYYALKKLKLKIAFCHLNESVYQIIVNKKLDAMIPIYDAELDAIKALE